MNEKIMACVDAYVVKKNGISKKTGKPYEMYVLRVDTGEYGEVELVLDTRSDRAGIILSMLGGKEE